MLCSAMQPSTYICRIGGFDRERIDMEAVKAAYDEEVRKGNLRYTDLSWNTTEFMPKWLYHKGDNANHVFYKENDGDSSEGRSQIAVNGRLALLNLYRFFRKQKGFEDFHFTYLAPECGVRETVRIKGKSTITLKDFIAGKCYEDAVCYSFYPVDLHVLEGEGLENIYLEEGKEALLVERRGRACAASGTQKGRKPKLDKQVEEDLIAENQRLRMEIDYLKKLRALILEEERQNRKHK